MGEETIRGLSDEIWKHFSDRLAESAIDQIVTKADLRDLATKKDLGGGFATKTEVEGLLKRLAELEKAARAPSSGTIVRPLWASLIKSGRLVQAGLLAVVLCVCLGVLGLVLVVLQLVGVPVGELLTGLSR